ncbi:MAG: hypothetical protein RLZZ352_1390 [Pseudomonadota bacterium]|jgi:plasmid stability protein
MANLTISVDENLVKQARIKALQEGTSLSGKIREFLTQYTQPDTVTLSPAIPRLPVSKARGGLLPGIDPCSHRSMLDAMDADDALRQQGPVA